MITTAQKKKRRENVAIKVLQFSCTFSVTKKEKLTYEFKIQNIKCKEFLYQLSLIQQKTHIHKYLHTHISILTRINTYIQPKDNAQCSNQISCIFSAIEHEKLRIQNSNK